VRDESAGARIAVAGISIECSTFSPGQTGYDDFAHYRGERIALEFPFLASGSDAVQVVPLQWSRSIPGAPVVKDAYDRIKSEILTATVDAGPWDGVYLLMHGAMSVLGMEDAEGDFVTDLRKAVGEEVTVVASYDLHGNISRRIFDHLDLITAYRHAPHTDAQETRKRGFDLLLQCLDRKDKPAKRWAWLPVLLPGEKTSTEWEPAQSLYQSLEDLSARPGIVDASILIGYAWADEPRSGASVLVYGDDEKMVADECSSLADRIWDLRREFAFGVPAGSFSECVDLAVANINQGTFPVIISDSGDNSTAGGVGDVTHALERLLRADIEGSVYASIPDADAVARCFEVGTGSEIALSVGGKLDRVHGDPIPCVGVIERLEKSTPDSRKAVLRCANVRVILTEKRTPFHHLDQFRELGIIPEQCPLIVVKIGYLVPELKDLAAKAYLALTPGAVNQDIAHLPYRRVHRPIFPLDAEMVQMGLPGEFDPDESFRDV
jgi:microcystin degradation protein MlrC